MPPRLSGRTPVWLFCLAVLAAWSLGAELAVFFASGTNLSGHLPGLLLWTFVVVSVAFLAVAGRRQITGGRQTARLIAQLKEALGSFGMLTETSLVALPLDESLQQLLARLCEVLETDVAAILLSDQEWEFTFRASYGFDAGHLEAFRVTPGRGMIGSIVATRLSQSIGGAERLGLLARQLGCSLATAAGCPILVEGRVIGVCVVGATGARPFDDRRLQLLQLVANRAGVDIDRARLGEAQLRSRAAAEEVRRHSVMLARTSEVLLAARDDYEENLWALVDVIVPEFADWCTIQLTDGGSRLRPLAARHRESAGPGSNGWTPSDAGSDTGAAGELDERFPETITLVTEVLDCGASRLAADGRALVVGIRVGDTDFGVMTVARDGGHTPFEASDVSTAEELAGRAAIAVERALRYQDVRDAAQAAERRAAQLHELVRASIDVQQPRGESEVLAKIAERTLQVLSAQTALVTAEFDSQGAMQAVAKVGHETVVGGPDQQGVIMNAPRRSADLGKPWRAGEWVGASVVGRQAVTGGMVAICASDRELSPDDEAILSLLAQMASSALDNAQLSHTIQTSEARWRVLVEAAPIGIVEVDLDGQVAWWNRAATALFAWPEYQSRNPSFGVDGPSFAPDTNDKLVVLWSEVIEGKELIDRELTATSPGGELRELAVSVAPLRSAGGTIYGILTLLADVTERRRLEFELRRAQRTEAIGQLAGGVAHDFNNLLTLITGYTELLERRLESDRRSLELVDGVRSAANRASLLTGQLLTISRRQIARPAVVAPADALRSVAEVLERVLGAGVELRWDLDPDAGQVSIDPAHLEQVILNLATNARDAMPDGGCLDISVTSSRFDGPHSHDLGLLPGRYVRISVADNGIGMDDETRRRCFEPLFTTKGPVQGTGLGLAAVKGVVGESGGAISVESCPGLGSTFSVYLPAVDDERDNDAFTGGERPAQAVAALAASSAVEARWSGLSSAEGGGSASARPPDPRTVLIAEDDEVLRNLMGRVLAREGYRVLEASSGSEALTVAEGCSVAIDALITDVMMPGLRGPDVAATLLAVRPGMRVLLISGGSDGALLTDGSLSTDDYLVAPTTCHPWWFLAKPFKPSQLLAQLGRLLDN